MSAIPKVSIICTFLNAERFLSAAVDSVLAQDFADFELILIDDGSADASTGIAKDYADRDPRIHYLDHPGHQNRGASPSRNLGLREARGELIAFIDSDDVWRPGKLSEQVSIMQADERIGMLCGTVNYWSSWAGGVDRLVPTGSRANSMLEPPETLLELYPFGDADAPCPSDLMFRRSLVDAGCTFEEHLTGPIQMYEDQCFFAKIYLTAPVYFASNVWLDYRQHADSCVSTVHRSGVYQGMKRDFLDWLDRYAAQRSPAWYDRIHRAIERSRHDLAHPLAARIRRFGKRLRAAARA